MVVSSPQYGGHTTPFSSFSVDGLWLRYVIDYSFGISRNNASAISCGIALYYLFFASRLSFPQEYTVVIENKNFSEKFLFFSGLLLFVLRTELLLTMCPTWSAGVFFIYPRPSFFGSRRPPTHTCASTDRAVLRADAGSLPRRCPCGYA